jgi:DNA-binding NtrC family response regulator
MARILLADQSDIVLDLMRIFLTEDGHELGTISSSAQLHEEISRRADTIDLLVLSADFESNSMTECITTLRNLSGQIELPVLVTIPPGAAEVQHEIESLSHVDSINKPFDRGSFLSKIKVISMLENFDKSAELKPSMPLPPEEEVSTVAAPKSAGSKSALTSDLVGQWLDHEGHQMIAEEVKRYLSQQGEDMLREIIWKIVPELAETQIRDAISKITEELEQADS